MSELNDFQKMVVKEARENLVASRDYFHFLIDEGLNALAEGDFGLYVKTIAMLGEVLERSFSVVTTGIDPVMLETAAQLAQPQAGRKFREAHPDVDRQLREHAARVGQMTLQALLGEGYEIEIIDLDEDGQDG